VIRSSLKLAVLLAALPLAAAAQDPAKVDPDHYKVLLDNAVVRVLKIDMPVGAKSVMHSHPDSMLVPLSSAKARFTMPDGKTLDQELVNGTAAYTPAFTHLPANVGTTRVEAILVEFKAKSPGSATLPTARPNAQVTPLADGPRATASKVTLSPEFHEAAGSTHDYDQVVIALGTTATSLAIEGQAPVTQWKRGDVQFIGRGVKHESKNPTGKPIDLVIVGIK
jgi:quercetin dioxygenase-like cupin family protein